MSRSRSSAARRSPATPKSSTSLPPAFRFAEARAIWLIAGLLGVALLSVVFGPHRIGDYWAESDFYGGYVDGARGILRGTLDPARYSVVGPVYEIALAMAGFLLRDWFLAAELLSVAAALATVLLWYRLLKARGSVALGAAAALLLATSPYFFRYGYSATTDALALAFQAAACWLALAGRSTRSAVLAGVMVGLASLTRYNSAVLLPALLLGLGLDRERPARGKATLALLAGFLAPVLAWLAFSLARGVPPSFQLHHIIAYEVFARSRGLSWFDYQEKLQPGFHNLWDVIARDPGAVFGHLVANAGEHLRLDASEVLGWPVAVAATAGLLLAGSDPALRALWPIPLAGALLFLSVVPVAHGGRYSLPIVPIAAALAAAPFASARLRGRTAEWIGVAALAVVAAASVLASVQLQTHDLSQLPTEVLEAAPPLRALARPGDRVIARKPHLAYYADLGAAPFPFATDLAGLAEGARREDARWLFFSVYEARTRPELAFLLDTTGAVPGLTAKLVTRSHPAVLYEIGPRFGEAPDWFANDTLHTVHAARARLLIEPRDALAMRTLAAYAMLRGDRQAARAELERAAVADPGDSEIRRLIDVLDRSSASDTAGVRGTSPGGARSGP